MISPYYVLTAAHCFGKNSRQQIEVWVGGLDINDGSQYEKWFISQRICHPGYDSNTMENDVCLLKLMTPIINKQSVKLANSLSDENTKVHELKGLIV